MGEVRKQNTSKLQACVAQQSGELHRPAPYHLLQPLAGEPTPPSQLNQEAAKDAEQCSPYLEDRCEQGHESAVACGLYTLPVVLRDDGMKPRCPFLQTQRFSAGISRTPTVPCVLAKSSIPHHWPAHLTFFVPSGHSVTSQWPHLFPSCWTSVGPTS